MDVIEVRKYVGKKVLIILRNNFQYTGVIPNFGGEEFTIIDKFKHELTISCNFISFIRKLEEENE